MRDRVWHQKNYGAHLNVRYILYYLVVHVDIFGLYRVFRGPPFEVRRGGWERPSIALKAVTPVRRYQTILRMIYVV